MKKYLLSILFTTCLITGYSQYVASPNPYVRGTTSNDGDIYLGLGAGINSLSGALGARFDAKITDRVTLGFGLGQGTWGYKLGFKATYLTNSHWCPNISLGRAFGTDIEVTRTTGSVVEYYKIREEAMNFFSLGIEKQWFTRRGNRWSMNVGYCFAVDDASVYPLNPNIVMSSAEKDLVKIVSPGGLVLEFGYAFKLK